MDKTQKNSHVVIDARMVGPHGIGRYVEQLSRGLKALGPSYQVTYLVGQGASWPQDLQTHEVQSPFLHPKEVWEIPQALKKLQANLYHSPSFASLWSCPCPWVVTIHDLIHLSGAGMARRAYYETLVKPFAKGAARLVTVSQTSRQVLSQWLKVDPQTIEVAPNAIECGEIRPEFPKSLGLKPRNYFLVVSNSKPHKNLDFLLRAYSELSEPNWPLVMVHGSEVKDDLNGRISVLPVLSDLEYESVLSQAGALLYPSLEEGFGRPPLEAMAHGVPALVSNIEAHREALSVIPRARDRHLINPRDEGAWVRAMEKAMDGATERPPEETSKTILRCYHVNNLAKVMDRVYLDVLNR